MASELFLKDNLKRDYERNLDPYLDVYTRGDGNYNITAYAEREGKLLNKHIKDLELEKIEFEDITLNIVGSFQVIEYKELLNLPITRIYLEIDEKTLKYIMNISMLDKLEDISKFSVSSLLHFRWLDYKIFKNYISSNKNFSAIHMRKIQLEKNIEIRGKNLRKVGLNNLLSRDHNKIQLLIDETTTLKYLSLLNMKADIELRGISNIGLLKLKGCPQNKELFVPNQIEVNVFILNCLKTLRMKNVIVKDKLIIEKNRGCVHLEEDVNVNIDIKKVNIQSDWEELELPNQLNYQKITFKDIEKISIDYQKL